MGSKKFRDLTLTARVLRDQVGYIASRAEMIEMLDTTDRTLRDWAQRGMPTIRVGPGQPRQYNTADVLAWTALYHFLCGTGRAPHHLSAREAIEHVLRTEMETDPGYYAIVPLEHDHPRRAAQLELAAAGIEPRPDDGETA